MFNSIEIKSFYKIPKVKGSIRKKVNLAKKTWFRVGGLAELLFKPKDTEDLIYFLKNIDKEIPITIIGATSNLLIRDGGISGIVIKLGTGFNYLNVSHNKISVGGGTTCIRIANDLSKIGISGLEFFIGIPGTIGGSIRMNAGAYGRETKDFLKFITAIDRNGIIHKIDAKDYKMEYRKTFFPNDWIFVSADFEGNIEDPGIVLAKTKKLLEKRNKTQPIKTATGGSTFKNFSNIKAWELINQAKCNKMIRGNARVSEKHSNFIVNMGDASANDIEKLGEDIRKKVKEVTGYNLDWEIKIIGERVSYKGCTYE